MLRFSPAWERSSGESQDRRQRYHRPPHREARTGTLRSADYRGGLPILLHVDPQCRGHDSTHVRALAKRMFAPHPELTVIMAHLGGSGEYGPWTRTVHRTLRAWLGDIEREGIRRHIFFELSAVALERESGGGPAMSAADAAHLRDDLRRDGFSPEWSSAPITRCSIP